MTIERDLYLTLDQLRSRRESLSCGFDFATLALAGVDAEVAAAEDRLEEFRENQVEAFASRRLSADEVERRRRCPAELYARVYG